MSLIHLYDIIKDESDLDKFANYNFVDHIAVTHALLRKFDITVVLLDIRVFIPSIAGVYGINHQAMHNAVNSALNLPSSDFMHVDFNDLEQVNSMRWLHAEEHRQWHARLGI